MDQSPPVLPPAGWYADPRDPLTSRYWDGSRWTDNRVPVRAAVPGATAQAPTNDKAIASLVLGLAWLGGLGSVLALVFGHQARDEIEESRGIEGGRSLATAGIVLGWTGIGLTILFVVVYAALTIIFTGLLLGSDSQ